MEQLKCLRCGHLWYQRTPEKPKYCPACKQHKWDIVARVRPVAMLKESGGKVGAPSKYPVNTLEIKQSVLLAWPSTPEGQRDFKKILSINSCISAHARRTGKKFLREGMSKGLLVTRLS